MNPIPTVNVNLRPCDCDGPHSALTGVLAAHTIDCAAKTVPIACPIQPSVTFTVRLGECVCGGHIGRSPPALSCAGESDACPARPIRVSCSISGKTWEESEVSEVDNGPFFGQALEACRARWGYVKSALLGHSLSDCPEAVRNMCAQRDAVFAALARLTRAEEEYYDARDAALQPINGHTIMRPEPHNRPSAHDLAAYVARLIEQVGILEGSQ